MRCFSVGHRVKFAVGHGPHGARFDAALSNTKGSLKNTCKTSYWSSMETVALNYLIFEKTVSLCMYSLFLATDRRTGRQTNG